MPKFIDHDYNQMKLLPVSFDRQILPGTFEHCLHHLIDNELDLSIFDHRYNNDDGGRPAFSPAILLKIVLLAYSRGMTSSRKIEALCRENVLFMAISADSHPHFTTIADFISSSHEEIAKLFQQVLLICSQLGLIGGEMFAVDGCKMPSNASKQWSGSKADLKRKADKIDRAVRFLLCKHRDEDRNAGNDHLIRQREEQQLEKLRCTSNKIKRFLAENDERKGATGKPVKGNITDNDSAKMKTGHGVIQGYTGIATVDSKHQVVVHAEAHGQGQEHGLLEPALNGVEENLPEGKSALRQAKVTADSGFHSTETLARLEERNIDAYIADTGFRSRDPRFADAGRYKPRTRPTPKRHYGVEDFHVDIEQRTCICPAGNSLWLKCAQAKITGRLFMQFQAHQADCDSCADRARCLRNIHQKGARQVNVKLADLPRAKNGVLERMRQKIDSSHGRYIYSQRLGTVEPVFGHIRETLGLSRFTLRGKKKVDGQWKLFTMLHNLLKIHRFGYA